MFCSRALTRAVTVFLSNEEGEESYFKDKGRLEFSSFLVSLEQWRIPSVQAAEDATDFALGLAHAPDAGDGGNNSGICCLLTPFLELCFT